MGTKSKQTKMLSFQNSGYEESILSSLCKLRKEKKLCDASLVVGSHEYPIHRAVLASVSSYFFEMFERKEKEHSFVLRDLEDHLSSAFEYLLDYCYTGRLEVPEESVKPVYGIATLLRIQEAADACSQFLADNLSVDSCLGIRLFAKDNKLKQIASDFIQANINDVTTSRKFYGLPQIPVEITGADQDLVESSDDKHMFELVLGWARENINPEKPRFEDLTEQVNVLHLNTDNSLTDFKDISDDKVKEHDGVVQDYKKTKRKMNTPNTKEKKDPKSHIVDGSNFRKFSINPECPVTPKEWSIIATYQIKDKSYMAITILNDVMATISIHYRAQSVSSGCSSSEEPDSPVSNGSHSLKFFERNASLTPLAVMSTARCAFGLEVLDGRLVACGGYDRSECLKSSEVFDTNSNRWILLSEMNVPRGRFSVTSVGGNIYAVGGSDGFREQRELEYYDKNTEMWVACGEYPNAKVSQGLASLDGKLYCIGGCLGQKSMNDCQVYDPKTNTWKSIAPLSTARYQAATCTLNGKIYAIGGTDAWICLNTVEIYDPETDKWQYGPQLNMARRGAGCDVLDGKIHLTGGSDGTQSLKTTEILNVEKGWVMGPPLSIPRANVGVITCGNRLFAVGGFSGKKFLDSMEFLTCGSDEWCCYLPVENSVIAHKVAKRYSNESCSDDKQKLNGSETSVDHNSNCQKSTGVVQNGTSASH